MRLAINWVMEDRDLDTSVEEEIDAMRESFDGYQVRVITREMMGEEEDDRDIEEDNGPDAHAACQHVSQPK